MVAHKSIFSKFTLRADKSMQLECGNFVLELHDIAPSSMQLFMEGVERNGTFAIQTRKQYDDIKALCTEFGFVTVNEDDRQFEPDDNQPESDPSIMDISHFLEHKWYFTSDANTFIDELKAEADKGNVSAIYYYALTQLDRGWTYLSDTAEGMSYLRKAYDQGCEDAKKTYRQYSDWVTQQRPESRYKLVHSQPTNASTLHALWSAILCMLMFIYFHLPSSAAGAAWLVPLMFTIERLALIALKLWRIGSVNFFDVIRPLTRIMGIVAILEHFCRLAWNISGESITRRFSLAYYASLSLLQPVVITSMASLFTSYASSVLWRLPYVTLRERCFFIVVEMLICFCLLVYAVSTEDITGRLITVCELAEGARLIISILFYRELVESVPMWNIPASVLVGAYLVIEMNRAHRISLLVAPILIGFELTERTASNDEIMSRPISPFVNDHCAICKGALVGARLVLPCGHICHISCMERLSSQGAAYVCKEYSHVLGTTCPGMVDKPVALAHEIIDEFPDIINYATGSQILEYARKFPGAMPLDAFLHFSRVVAPPRPPQNYKDMSDEDLLRLYSSMKASVEKMREQLDSMNSYSSNETM